MTVDPLPSDPGRDASPPWQLAAEACWQRIGVSGDRSCPELNTYVHCRNCPVFAGAARAFFDRPAPAGYLAEWTRWLAGTDGHGPRADREQVGDRVAEDAGTRAQTDDVSVLIFRLGSEWLAFPARAVAEVTAPRPVHRVPHRSNRIFAGLISLQGHAELCMSLHGLMGVDESVKSSKSRLIVLRDRDRAENWTFVADEVVGVHRPGRSQWHGVPSTLINPAVAFSQAVLSCDGRSIGLLDEQRVFAAFRSLQP